jgi:RNA polymerase-binding transcription factor DksA
MSQRRIWTFAGFRGPISKVASESAAAHALGKQRCWFRLQRRSVVAEQTGKAGQALQGERVSAAKKMQAHQNISVAKSAGVLEEIWHTAGRNLPTANLAVYSSLIRKLRAMKADVFGTCLCCKNRLGLSRLAAEPWTPLCTGCQAAADRDDVEVLRRRSRS